MSVWAEETVKTDVLVVGGGGAAARAAIEASDCGVQVLMVVKGIFGESGSTAYRISNAAGFQAALGHSDHEDNPEVHFANTVSAAYGMCDVRLAKIVAYEAPKMLFDLITWGVDFEKIDDKYIQELGCFSTRPRTFVTRPFAYPIICALKDRLKDKVEIREKTMITSLLTRNGTCMGAVGVNERGKLVVFKAKSTILATGGAGQLFKLNFNPEEITGDGYALAYRAGADLVNMEFIQIGFGMVYPMKSLIEMWNWAVHPEVYNVAGERFLERYLPKGIKRENVFELRSLHFPFSTCDIAMYLDIAISKEILAGRGTEHMGIYIDFTKVPQDIIKKVGVGEYEWFLSRGVDICEKPIEVAPFAHAFNGGVLINEKAETTLPGLYGAGETAGGPHGADRPGGNMLATCQVFGARAGKYAAKRAMTVGELGIDEKQVSAEYKLLSRIHEGKGGVKVSEAKRKIQETMWTNALVVRNEKCLNECVNELEQIRKDELPKLYVENDAELFQALAIRNLLDVGNVVTRAALLRRESRGSHYREDFPYRNDKEWLKSIIINAHTVDMRLL